MTGFGQGSADIPGMRISVSLRTVNNRFADVRLRLPSELAPRERDLRKRILDTVRRGRVDVNLTFEPVAEGEGGTALNRALLSEVLAAGAVLRDEFGLSGELDVRSVLSLSGMLRVDSPEIEWDEGAVAALFEALDGALQALDADRRREGANLRDELLERLDAMGELVASVRKRAAEIPATVRDRLIERLDALGGEIALDPGRVAQEAVLLAERSDVTEEIVRLEGHLDQLRTLLVEPDGATVGKRLDFLLQEILRETNTVNSKPSDLELSRFALALKAESEKVREQIQNLE